jgi:hypothetical protein
MELEIQANIARTPAAKKSILLQPDNLALLLSFAAEYSSVHFCDPIDGEGY